MTEEQKQNNADSAIPPVPVSTEQTACQESTEESSEARPANRSRKHGAVASAFLVLAIFLLSGVLLLIAIALTGRIQPQPATAENVAGAVSEAVNPSVVLIYAQNSDGCSYGTGFFLREDGYIATNAHVIKGYSDITVTLYSGEERQASVIAQSASDDLALLRIRGTGYPAVKTGDSAAVRVGDLAVVIGNPAGTDAPWTTTKGIISAVNRRVAVEGEKGSVKEIPMLQTDATVNKGNSGGPLCNREGEVIGIVTSRLTGYDHISFAIPINHAMEVFAAMLGDSAETK